MPVELFPVENGVTQFKYTQSVVENAENVLENVENVISNWTTRSNCKIKTTTSGRKSMSYAVQLSCGREVLFFFERAASKVKFNCSVSFINGVYTVQLSNFETNRNNIRGEAKNDGDPNYIQWQRVNSLLKEYCNEVKNYNPSSRKHRRIAYEYNNRIAYECGLYAQEWNMLKQFIDDLVGAPNNESASNAVPVVFDYNIYELKDDLPFGNFKTRFVEEGKEVFAKALPTDKIKVFVYGGSSDYEQAGAAEIIKNIVIDSYASIVNTHEQADYSIGYVVDTSGRDKAIVTITDKDGKRMAHKSKSASENVAENIEIAESIYSSCVAKFLKQL